MLALRLVVGMDPPAWLGGLIDTAMILGALLFPAGVRKFVARTGGEALLIACVDATADCAKRTWTEEPPETASGADAGSDGQPVGNLDMHFVWRFGFIA